MATTQLYKAFAQPTQWIAGGKRALTAFIIQNTLVFEGLCRAGAPFGGNWLNERR